MFAPLFSLIGKDWLTISSTNLPSPSLFMLLLVFLTSCSLPKAIESKEVHYIHWNTSNPMFRIDNTDHIIDINRGNLPLDFDQANIVCPNKKSGTWTVSDNEKYIIYNVSKEEYETCRITDPTPRVIMVCDDPSVLRISTIVFRSFTPIPGGLEFKPGQDYYFISTSTDSDLERRVGGRCKSHNMKVTFKVAANSEFRQEVGEETTQVTQISHNEHNSTHLSTNSNSVNVLRDQQNSGDSSHNMNNNNRYHRGQQQQQLEEKFPEIFPRGPRVDPTTSLDYYYPPEHSQEEFLEVGQLDSNSIESNRLESRTIKQEASRMQNSSNYSSSSSASKMGYALHIHLLLPIVISTSSFFRPTSWIISWRKLGRVARGSKKKFVQRNYKQQWMKKRIVILATLIMDYFVKKSGRVARGSKINYTTQL